MKKTSFLLGVLAVLLTQGILYAQDPRAVCAANQREAQRLLPLTGQVLDKDSQEHIYNLVKPCADAGDATAICNLAILYKDGIQVDQDLDRSFELFTQSAEAGHDKAKYALGYFYMKGLGSVGQDYEKAVEYFRDSFDPMARHWLGYCMYFGYGIEQNKAEAIRILEFNTIGNSDALFDQLFDEIEPTTSDPITQFTEVPENISDYFNYINTRNQLNVPNAPGSDKVLDFGTYEGHLVEYDWSGKHALRYFPFVLELVDYQRHKVAGFTIGGKKYSTTISLRRGSIVFDDMYFTLPRIYTDDPRSHELSYTLRGEMKFIDNLSPFASSSMKQMATPQFKISEFGEPGNPMMMLFGKFDEGGEHNPPSPRISDIKIAPNPITGSTFTVNYKWDSGNLLYITAHPVSGNSRTIFLFTGRPKNGNNTLTLDAIKLKPNQVYILGFDAFDGAPQQLRVIRSQ